MDKASFRNARSGYVRAAYAVTALGLAVSGVLLAVGPESGRSTRAYDVFKAIMPVEIWGLLFAAIGLFKLFAWLVNGREVLRFGSVAGGTICLMWAFGLTSSAILGTNHAWASAPMWYVLAVIQLMSAASSWER